MKSGKLGSIGKAVLMVAATALILIGSRVVIPVAAQGPASGSRPPTRQELMLHDFTRTGHYGWDSASGVIRDANGNLYGTTEKGGEEEGKAGAGTVFELSPQSGGGWTSRMLHHFQMNDVNGSVPVGGLIFDGAGNLYGTTENGGNQSCFESFGGCGTVFELSPQSDGGWTEQVLHSFMGGHHDGSYPLAGLTLDSAGNLYGTTQTGGVHDGGTVFEVTP